MKSDPNLYVHESKKLYVLAYVDDLMFFGSCADVSTLIADLQKDLLLKVTGTLDEGNDVLRPEPEENLNFHLCRYEPILH